MAKKRQKAEEEDFVPPVFDEVAFMRREREAAKAAVITLALAVALAAASAGLSLAGAWPVALLLLILTPFTLKFIYPLGRVDMTTLDRKTWAALVAILILAWVSLWILFINPPFADTTPPIIKEVRVDAPTGGYVKVKHTSDATDLVTMPNATSVNVVAFIPDNDPVVANFTLKFQNGSFEYRSVPCDHITSQCVLPITGLVPNKSVTITITAHDSHGNMTQDGWTFELLVT